ncbi:Facilitated trehalose transporter Tret1 [Chionoecetes opilio]|uniref:Facilitated trehalose transporter Tret1 n=1 Tax=Chionoecetes opilio TaxID=41210 RepID=A0A8J5CDC4_CHIOP|nr:Facilitated trehalose transporter Tret1 [Chionoecetes opilio]
MMTEDGVDGGEVMVVVPQRTVHMDELFPGAKPLKDTSPSAHRQEILAACVMALSTFSGGILEGFTSPALPTLLQDTSCSRNASNITLNSTAEESYCDLIDSDSLNDTTTQLLPNMGSLHLSEEQASWLGSLLLLGACLGAMVSSGVISLGRRRAVLASALPRLIGWIMMAAASDVYMMYGGRFLTGVSVGIVTSAAPVYISEVAHSSIRGALSCVVQLGVNMGIFTVVLLGTFVGWRGLSAFGALTVLVYFVATLFIPNSPVWLVSMDRQDAARDALTHLRGSHYCVEYELQQIISTKVNQQTYSWKDLVRQRSCLVPLGVVGLVTVVNRCSGYNAIITYCATFLHQAVPAVSEYWAAAGVTFMQVISTFGAVVSVDRLGRRKLLMASITAMGLALATIAMCELATQNGAGGSWVAVLAAVVYVSAYSIGIGPVTWVLVGEMFPQAARGKAAAIISVLNWFLAFIITKTYFSLETVTGIAGTCSLYASVCLLGLILVYIVVPETKGHTLGEIEAYFTYSRHSWGVTKNKRSVVLNSILEHDTGASDNQDQGVVERHEGDTRRRRESRVRKRCPAGAAQRRRRSPGSREGLRWFHRRAKGRGIVPCG